MFESVIEAVRGHYRTNSAIPLHAPVFEGNEQAYVADTVKSTFVSSVGHYVDQFEVAMAAYTQAERAVAVVNGTAALHIALRLAGVQPGDLVITQALTFVATCNAISYCNAAPVFCDVDRNTMGLSPDAVADWLDQQATLGEDGVCRRRSDGRPIRACVPMHSFGHPVRLQELVDLCSKWSIVLIEDAAESLGSTYRNRHTGTFGQIGTQSFNGNKIITTGGGGMILTNAVLGAQAKHLTTTAKQPHPYEYVHDQVGYNYRLPNINAALGVAQLERIEDFVAEKRALALHYQLALAHQFEVFQEPVDCRSNYWLNAVICEDRTMRDALLAATNGRGVMTRPIWSLMTRLAMYRDADRGDLSMSAWLEDRVVNIPSGVRGRSDG